MNVYTDLNTLPEFNNAVITIGSFDGVHHGHQKIIERVKQLAHDHGGESIIVTFHPHPRQVIYPRDKSLKLLTTIEEKSALLERFGVDNLVIVPFTVEFSQQSPDEYIEKFLVGKFNPKYIVIGYDHRFGLNRQGDVHFLKWYGKKAKYEVIEIEPQEIDDIAVSSTKIRNALDSGDITTANALLHHRFTLSGKVVRGRRIGHTIGFPTANLLVSDPNKLIPPNGIYAAYVLHDGQRYRAMMYIGHRPTLPEFKERTIEVNIFEFNQDIYGHPLTIELIAFIRADAKQEGLQDLKKQLARDKHKVLSVLKEKETERPDDHKKKNSSPEVAVVILNYNGKHHLEKFLPGILQNLNPAHRLIVADNGSSDDSIDYLRLHFPQVTLLPLGANYGFAKGYNLALSRIDAQYYVLLNSDVETTPHWLHPIIELMKSDSEIGACQPKIRSILQRDQFEYAGAAGGWLDLLGYPFCRGRIFNINEVDQGQYDDRQEIFWATGAAIVVRAGLFRQMSGFDPSYFAHSEEIDLCWRMKRAGYKIMVEPRSVVYHLGGGTLDYQSPRKTYLNFRNSLFTLVKNEPVAKLLWLIPLRLLLDGVAGGLFLTQGKFKHIWSILRAHASFYRTLGALRKRRKQYIHLIETHRIGREPNKKGRYGQSIVWEFYILRKKFFSQLEIPETRTYAIRKKL